jgi:hypothetical protein
MSSYAPEVLADPIGVIVDLIAHAEPHLDRMALVEVVTSVVGGRAKQRMVAQAMLERPAVLTDGRSPAPRAVADLLNALRSAGASSISPPICAECGKQLRTFQRRDQDWYCGVCGPRREPCASCGNVRVVHVRDRQGRPRCVQCPPDEGRDPVGIVMDVVATIDPNLPAEVVATAVAAAVPRAGRRYQLAWALQDRPDLLTGSGAHAPLPAVLRLIDRLLDAGADRVVQPPCPRCNRVIHLHRRIEGQWLCRNCVAKSRAQPCSRCGTVREAAARDDDGRPLCPNCLITDPANLEVCVGCDRRRPVSIRTPDGPLCPSCRPWQVATCGICGRAAPCAVSQTTGEPWCVACKQRRARCSGCGRVDRIRGGTKTEPLCATCTRPDPNFWTSCPTCGETGRIHARQCARCAIDQRLHTLLSDETGEIRPGLRALYQALATTERPSTVAAWLDKSAAPSILKNLDAEAELTHAVLDELPPGKPVEHLRSVLVAIGTLPARDEQMVRLERWIATTIAQRDDPDQQQLLHRYAVWHLLRRLRHRTEGTDTTHDQLVGVRQHVKAAIGLLDWLTGHDLTLATCRQNDLDGWISSDQATHRRETGNFVRWARKQKLTSLDFPATRWGGPSRVIDTETRWEQARRLLHNETLDPEDRVAGLLVLLYAQWPAAISRLTLAQIHADDQQVRLNLGREPIILPEPLASLVRQLIATRRGHATIGSHGTSPWLFPGGQPGRPISAFRLAERLREVGIYSGQARSTALFQLATDLPAAVLARMLGIHISVAVAWQRASAGDWTSYAAQVSQRAVLPAPDRDHQPAWENDQVNADSLDQDWLASWSNEINQALKPFLATFEATYGYPPGDNLIRTAEASHHPNLAHPLDDLYEAIHELSLPDIGNGYFIHPADHVFGDLEDQGPVGLADSGSGTVFASDGGGILYAITGNGTIHRSHAASRDSGFDLIANNLGDFLTQLRRAVITFIHTGEPGKL